MFEGLRFKHWQTTIENGIVTLGINREASRVNTLARAVLEELDAILERIAIEPPRGLLIHSLKSTGFIAGADIHEFKRYEREGRISDAIEYGQQILQKLADLPCPSIAAIHGHCMGGGTELALACRYRIASNDPKTRIGLPEVMLGIHPGWGGTARLPRLIGAPAALQLMLTGRSLSAQAARTQGLIDRVSEPQQLIEEARKLLEQAPLRNFPKRLQAWASNLWPVRQILAPIIRKQTAAKANPRHYPAPFAIIEVWRRGGGSLRQRLRLEAHSVVKLAATPTAHNLIRVHFLQERIKGLAGAATHDIQHVHVVGAGVMGGDIAAWCALRGFEVSLQDRERRLIEPALARAGILFERRLKTPERIAAAKSRLHADIEGSEAAKADLVIEAIFENTEAKQAVYAQLESQLSSTALLSSNTSSIPIAELARSLGTPQRFFGLHFFNPVARMPLIEVVRHPHLDATVEHRALAFCRAIDKLPLPVKGSPGFLVNRILVPYLLESIRCLSEGVPRAVLDRIARHFGMPMGPIELADTIGLDVAESVGRELAPFLGWELPEGIEHLLASGKRGKKDDHGFYVWKEGKPIKPVVPKNYQVAEDLEARMILPMLNEAVACLAEGVVADAELLDAGVIFGTGFAPFLGGPIQYIRSQGADHVKAQLQSLAERHGPRFKPRDGWNLPALGESPIQP